MNIKFNTVYAYKQDMSNSLPALQDVMRTSGQARGIYANSVADEVFGSSLIRAETKGSDAINAKTGRLIEIRTVNAQGAVFLGLSCEIGKGRKVDFDRLAADVDSKDYIVATIDVDGSMIYSRFMMLAGSHVRRLLGQNRSTITKKTVAELYDMFPTKVFNSNKIVTFSFSDAE
jgi:hypothetical protein